MKETIRVVARDGYMLSATWYIADNPDDKVVLINAATGVRQEYYHDFATFLSKRGINVYTFDYRGIGGSRPEDISHMVADMKDWAKDVDGMISHISHVHQRSRLVIIGHSVGGQLIGMANLARYAEALILVGAQTPYWKNYPGTWMKTKLLLFWRTIIPLFTKLFGYFPASRFGLFEDLPAQVALQWARWGRSREYIFQELPDLRKSFACLEQPALMISFTDDVLAPLPAVLDLKKYFTGLKIDHRHYDPDDLAQQAIGHFGFFKRKLESAMWKEIELWIHQHFPSGRTKVA
jgi:predicted alpha/beta hydrolase